MAAKHVLGVLILGAFTAPVAQATILPENHLYLEDCLECEANVTEEDFKTIIERAKNLFSDVVERHDGNLTIRGNWNDATVNASATQLFGSWIVNMYGGLARRPEVTPDAFTMVLCHEIGHHLAGFPFVSNWGADEGQSDYFATNHCSALFWGSEVATNAKARAAIAAEPKALCDESWSTQDAQNLCYRTMLAGKALANLLGALKDQTADWTTPDTSIVRTTDHNHPAAQCRLDTYIAGAVCTAPYDIEVIPGKRSGRGYNDRQAEADAAPYSCGGDYRHGARPLCWFAPSI